MYKRLTHNNALQFTFDGCSITANEGDTVAAALLCSGKSTIRHSHVSLSPRGPFCLMGACYECLVRHEGKTVQACMLTVQPGMVIERVRTADKALADRKEQ